MPSAWESVHGLLPLTTLEHYPQQALVDELAADSNDCVPDFVALTQNGALVTRPHDAVIPAVGAPTPNLVASTLTGLAEQIVRHWPDRV